MGTPKKERQILDEDLDNIKEISAKVKQLREQQGYSFEGFANHIGLHRTTYYKLEQGKNFNISTFLAVLRGLELSPLQFFKLLEEVPEKVISKK